MDRKEEIKLIKRLVAFCILMENNYGIIYKAPTYILEKYRAIIENEHDEPEVFLDVFNQAKFKNYMEKWLKEET